jgi:hypothetical protein
MEAPHEFDFLAHCFYQGIFESYPDRAAAIATAIGGAHFNAESLARLKSFLDDLLEKASEKELEDAWRKAGANYGFRGPDATRRFLTQVRQMLDERRDVLTRQSREGRVPGPN